MILTKTFYYCIILPISLLPFSILYLFSDALFIIVYHIIGYRKKVVLTNLQNSFPEKSTKELNIIMYRFYIHFCDIIMESVKGFSISEKEIRNRFIIRNPVLANKYAKTGQSIIFVTGHYNNWEMCAQAFPLTSDHYCCGIYKPLTNSFLNQKIFSSRSKFGCNLIYMQQTKKSFEDKSQIKAIAFVSDQSPTNAKRSYWMKFLNQDTGVSFGVEKYSKEYNCPVIYASIIKVKRGYYEVYYSIITENPNNEHDGKITRDYTTKLEKEIINKPQYWLWSHKRWKHKK